MHFCPHPAVSLAWCACYPKQVWRKPLYSQRWTWNAGGGCIFRLSCWCSAEEVPGGFWEAGYNPRAYVSTLESSLCGAPQVIFKATLYCFLFYRGNKWKSSVSGKEQELRGSWASVGHLLVLDFQCFFWNSLVITALCWLKGPIKSSAPPTPSLLPGFPSLLQVSDS